MSVIRTGVLSLVPFFARAKKGTRCRAPPAKATSHYVMSLDQEDRSIARSLPSAARVTRMSRRSMGSWRTSGCCAGFPRAGDLVGAAPAAMRRQAQRANARQDHATRPLRAAARIAAGAAPTRCFRPGWSCRARSAHRRCGCGWTRSSPLPPHRRRCGRPGSARRRRRGPGLPRISGFRRPFP